MTIKSLEILESLFDAFEKGLTPIVARECNPAYTIIKQDLKHLEYLDKENKEVKIINDWLKEDISQLKEQLEHNNKTLSTQHNLIIKYKNAIEVLKEKISFEVILNLCDDEEKEILKEILENDK